MNDDEPVIKLQVDLEDLPSDIPVRLQPQRRLRDYQPTRESQPALRLVEESNEKPTAPEVPTLEQEPRRKAFEGKSVDYSIDEIMQPEVVYDPNAIEEQWGSNESKLPTGWLVLTIVGICLIGLGMVRVLEKNRRAEKRIVSHNIEVAEPVIDKAHDLVQSVDSTVRQYLAARTIEEKLPHVRHAEQMRPRMEIYYAKHPLQPEKCELVTNYKPLTVNGRTFWKVLAITDQKKTIKVMLEQISDSQVLVDWECLVDYETVPWDDYLREPAFGPVTYRLLVNEEHRYIAEFMNESQWACYRLTKPTSEGILYGYVRRDSPLHLMIHQARESGSTQMILKIQASSAMKAKSSVVIQELISDSMFRMNPPKSIKD